MANIRVLNFTYSQHLQYSRLWQLTKSARLHHFNVHGGESTVLNFPISQLYKIDIYGLKSTDG